MLLQNFGNRFKGTLIILFALLIVGCSAATPGIKSHNSHEFPQFEKRDDPLIGKIYSSKDHSEISVKSLLPSLLASDIIYLGEKHDNREHHEIQMQLIEALVKKGKKPSIGIELFSVDQTGYLMGFVFSKSHHGAPSPEKTEQRLRLNLGWDQRSDKMWKNYFSIVELAKKYQLTIFGMDIPAGIIRRITMKGVDGLTGTEKFFIHSTNFQDEIYKKFMFQQFTDGHCGWSDKNLMEKLYGTWLARNDAMAKAIQSVKVQNPEEPMIILLGGGHSVYKLAVYDRLAYLMPQAKQLNIGIQEVSIQPLELKDYFSSVTVDERIFPPPYDYIWFTQRDNYMDPCVRFKKSLSIHK